MQLCSPALEVAALWCWLWLGSYICSCRLHPRGGHIMVVPGVGLGCHTDLTRLFPP